MNLLQSIQSGTVPRPQRVVIYAPEGLGKTTLASQFPKPLFFDFEGGTHHMDVARVEPTNLLEVETALAAIAKKTPASMGFQTVVMDTIDWLENLVIEAVCIEGKKDSIEDFGYGKGYVHAAERMLKVLALLDAVKGAGFHVVLLAHSEIKKFELPDAAGAFDRYQLKLEKRIEPLVKEWADALLFGNWKTRVAEKDGGKFKGVGGKERVLYCNRSASFDAKNRFGLRDEEPWSIDTIKAAFASIGAPWETAAPEAKAPEAKAAAAQAEPDPDTIPGIATPNPELVELARICGPHREAVEAFLRAKGELAEGRRFEDVSPSYRTRILRRPAEFLKAAGAIAQTAQAA